jgi:hypothetical protein
MVKHRKPNFPAFHGTDAALKRRANRRSLLSSIALPSNADAARASDGTSGSAFHPVLLPAEETFTALGIGRTKGFELIRKGDLIARKIGSRTLVEVESIRCFVAGLPRAGEVA